jgi:GT2 family glycosyltransferase
MRDLRPKCQNFWEGKRMEKINFSTTIIIPNFNGVELLKKNLPQVIRAYRYKRNTIIEIILVDDGSTDSSIAYVRKNFPEVKIVSHKINRGFIASVNTGARSARGDLLVLLNTDVFPNEDFLEQAIPHFNRTEVFAVSLHETGYGWSRGKFEDGFIVHAPGSESEKTHDTFWVSGGSGVFRRSYWMKLGGMDEKLLSPFYWEDVDICYRAAKRGWSLLWEPRAKVVHEHEATMSKISQDYKRRIQERNQLILVWKNITSFRIFRKHILGLVKRISRHPGYLRIVFMALRKIRGVIKARVREMKEGKISDEAIFSRFNKYG